MCNTVYLSSLFWKALCRAGEERLFNELSLSRGLETVWAGKTSTSPSAASIPIAELGNVSFCLRLTERLYWLYFSPML